MIDIEWEDYGYAKNWKSPWGDIELERRNSDCNRGRVTFKIDTRGAVNFILEPLLSNAYFFDKQRALKHLESTVELASRLTPEQLRSLKNNGKGTPFKTVQGKDCFCYLVETKLDPGDFSLIIFNVQVDPGKEETFVVDWADMFPRFYLDVDIAIAEMDAWMTCRKQYLSSERVV